jgi:hypothetical protein
MAPDLASQLRWAPALLRVLWLQTSPPSWGGLRRCHVSNGSGPRLLWLWTSPLGWGGLQRCQMFYGSGSRLSAKVGSDAATCPMPLDLTSQLRWTPTLPYVIWLQTSPPDWGGLRRCHVSCGSRPHLPTGAGSDAATCPTAPCGPQVSSIRKSLPDLPVQLGTHVPNAHTRFQGASR